MSLKTNIMESVVFFLCETVLFQAKTQARYHVLNAKWNIPQSS